MIKSFARKLLSRRTLAPLKGARFIFTYHDISRETAPHYSPYQYSTRPDILMDHLSFFNELCNPVSLDDILHNDNLSKDKIHVAITFDDGFESVRNIGYPLLKKFKIPFSLFLNKEAIKYNQIWVSNLVLQRENQDYLKRIHSHLLTDTISLNKFIKNPIKHLIDYQFDEEAAEVLRIELPSDQKTYLDRSGIMEFIRDGIPIGNHTCRHLVLSNCDAGLQRKEIMGNKKYLEEEFDVEVPYFALPFGKKEHFTKETISIGTEIGCTHIFTSNINPFKPGEDYLDIPRITLTNETVDELTLYLNRTLFKKYQL